MHIRDKCHQGNYLILSVEAQEEEQHHKHVPVDLYRIHDTAAILAHT